MQHIISLRRGIFLIPAIVVLGITARAALVAAPPDQAIQLRITGPDGQWVSLAIRYFSGDEGLNRWTTNQQRAQLIDGVAVIALEKEHDGYAVDVFSPTQQPLRIELRKGDVVLEAKVLASVGHKIVRSGVVSTLDNLRATEIGLKADDQNQVDHFLGAFDRADTKSIVSDIKVANIDWPSLNAFARLVGEILGAKDGELNGWAKWGGKQNTTVFAGVIPFQRGNADAVLVMLDGKLVDFVLKSESLPKHWHTGDAAIREYAERGSSLIRLMFAGELETAHAIFSYRVREQITIEKLAPIHQTLVGQFGDTVESIELRDHRLEKAESDDDRKLVLVFELRTDREVLCDGTVEVFLDHVNGLVPRGHITSFNVKEKGPSIPPAGKQKIGNILSALAEGDPNPFKEQLSKQMLLYLSEQQLSDELDRWQKYCGDVEQPVIWSDWSDTAGKKGIEGPVRFSNGEANVRVDFGTNNVIGVTVVAETYAGSTLDCVRENKAMAEHAKLFWRHLFSKQLDAGYEMLPELFQKQLSRDQFLEIAGNLAKVKADVTDVSVRSVRFDTKPGRVSTPMIEVICMLEFDQKGYETVKCEYHIDGPDKFDLYTFDTEFMAEFPVRFGDHSDFLNAVTSGNGDRIIDLFHQSHRQQIDSMALQALLVEIRRQWGGLDLSSTRGVAMRRYAKDAEETTKVAADLSFDNATVPTEWTYVYGHLKSFHFGSTDVARFARNIKDTSAYRARSERLFKHWFDGEVRDALELLMPDLHKQETVAQMTQLKQRVGKSLGKLQSITHQSESFHHENNTLQQRFLLNFADGEVVGTATFAFDALHSLMIGANISPVKASDADNKDAEDEKGQPQQRE